MSILSWSAWSACLMSSVYDQINYPCLEVYFKKKPKCPGRIGFFFFFLLLSIINYYINSTIKHICTVRVALPPHNSSVTGFILSLGYFACSPLLCDVAGKCTKDALSLSQVSPRNVFCKCLKLHPVLQ